MSSRPEERTGLTIGEVAALAGVAPSAVRFYERYGLVASWRTPANQRRFPDDAPCRIQVARVAQRVGLTLREIVEVIGPLDLAEASQDDWGLVVERLGHEARLRIGRLEAALEDLASGQRVCELDPLDPLER